MRYLIHDNTLDAKKARILINALIDCAKVGVRPSFSINKMLWGISLYLECGSFNRENWRTYHRVSDAAKQVRDSSEKYWKKDVTFEHVRPISMMYQMLLDERDPDPRQGRIDHWRIPAGLDNDGGRTPNVATRVQAWRQA
jgi:hypothetical protein